MLSAQLTDFVLRGRELWGMDVDEEVYARNDLVAYWQWVIALHGTELIGKFVQAIVIAPDGSEMLCEGVVTSVVFNADGSAVLELDTGEAILASDVVRVTTLDQVEEELTESDESSDEDDETDETDGA